MLWVVLLLLAEPFDSTFQAGLTALNQNNLAVAQSRLEAASKLEPRNPQVWLALAQTYWKLHEAPAAETAARNAEAFSTGAPILHGLALYYSETGNYPKAAELEARYAQSEPAAIAGAAQLYLRAGQPRPAVELARKALARDDRAELHDLLGKAYEAGGDPEGASREFRRAIRENAFEESYYFDLAQTLLKQQKFAPALEALDAGRKNFDKSPQLELAAGVAYYGLRRFPEAIDAFLRTIQLDPQVEQPHVFLGRMLDQAEGRLPKIVEVFANFSRTAPDHYLSNFLYGKALALENPPQAEALLRRSIALNDGFWESHFELGALLERRGKLDGAAQEVRRSIELNPENAPAHYRLARLYDRLGKSTEAQAERELHAKLLGKQ